MNRRLILMFAALTTAGVSLGASSLESAQTRLKAAVSEVLALAGRATDKPTLMKEIGPVLAKHMSFEVMTRRAIGPGWREFSAAQQKQAVGLFTKLILRSYGSRFTIGQMPEVKYQSASETAAGRVDVSTFTIYQGSRYGVVYRMEEAEGWLTTDVVIEGVSMVANYRSQFDPVFKKGGVTAVMAALEKSAARSE